MPSREWTSTARAPVQAIESGHGQHEQSRHGEHRQHGTDVFVDVETGVNIAISKVRQALRDSTGKPEFVETVVGKGYRFVAAVEVVSGADAMPSAEARDGRPLDTSVAEQSRHAPAPAS